MMSQTTPGHNGHLGSDSTLDVPKGTRLLALENASKYFGSVIALEDVSIDLKAGEVHALLGDNGAGKSTLIKILSGVYQQDKGRYLVGDEEVHFNSPRDALARGIATVYQDLAMIPLMGISRNFFLGQEPEKGWGSGASGRHPLRGRAAVGRHRPRGLLRGEGADP
jgi:ABC-type sugar transport system ATPase subunit